MKHVKVIMLCVLSMLFLPLFISNKCLAASDSDYVDISSKSSFIAVDKVLTIKFNNSLKKSTVNNSDILVLDEDNKHVNINVKSGADNKSIVVSTIHNYEYEKGYMLIVKKEYNLLKERAYQSR